MFSRVTNCPFIAALALLLGACSGLSSRPVMPVSEVIILSKAALPANAVKTCATPLEDNQLLAQRFGVRGTPAIFLANGQQVGGFLPADKLEQALATVQ